VRDGELTRSNVRIIAAQVELDTPFIIVNELIDAGRWTRVGGTGYVIQDYLQ
jgi:hypothetical protein